MPDFTQAGRPFRLTTPLGPDVLLCANWQGSEQVSSLWELRVEAWSARRDIAARELLHQPVALECHWEGQPVRRFDGIVRRVERIPAPAGAPLAPYVLTIVPKAWLLTQQHSFYSFQDKSVREIVEFVLRGIELPAPTWRAPALESPVPCRTMWDESPWAFLNRMLEREGAWYTWLHDEPAGTLLVGEQLSSGQVINQVRELTDSGPGALLDAIAIRQGPVPSAVVSFSGSHAKFAPQVAGRYQVTEVGGPDAFRMSSSQLPANRRARYVEAWELGAWYDDIDAGGTETASRLADLDAAVTRIAEREAQAHVAASARLAGESRAIGLAAGAQVRVASEADASVNGLYFIVGVQHAGGNGSWLGGDDATPHYTNSFEAAPQANVYRPLRTTPVPRIAGVVTARVVGPEGEEIHTDKYGRVRVVFGWDARRYRSPVAGGDCWVRVAQPLAGTAWGAFFLPRVGHEVLVSFIDGDPDQPIVVGSLYNETNTTFQQLPAQKTQTGIRTRTSPQGTAQTYNELRFDDRKDEEHVWFRAQSQFTGWVTNKVTFHIEEGDQVVTHKKGKRTLTHDEGDDTHELKKGNRSVTLTEGNDTLRLTKGDLTVMVSEGTYELHAVKDVKITSDEERLALGGKKDVIVLADTGTLVLRAKQDDLKIQAQQSKVIVEGQSEISLTCGPASIVIGPTGIELKVGPSSIKVTANAVELKGVTATLEGQAVAQVTSSGPTMVKGNPTLVG